MEKYIVTIPLASDLDPSDILEAALEFGAYLRSGHGGRVVQDEEETSVADAE